MSGFRMRAKRKGQCEKCGLVIVVGQDIDWDRDAGTATHALCADMAMGRIGGDAQTVAIRLGYSLAPAYVACARCGRAFDESVDPTDCPHNRDGVERLAQMLNNNEGDPYR